MKLENRVHVKKKCDGKIIIIFLIISFFFILQLNSHNLRILIDL